MTTFSIVYTDGLLLYIEKRGYKCRSKVNTPDYKIEKLVIYIVALNSVYVVYRIDS